MRALLRHLLTAPVAPAVDSIDALRARTRALAEAFPVPFDRGAATALACDRVNLRGRYRRRRCVAQYPDRTVE